MPRTRLFCTILIIFRAATTAAQEFPEIERLLEENEITPADDAHEEIMAALVRLAANPLRVNTATFDEWKQLPFLSDAQIDHILQFRERVGAFHHAEELLLVAGISRTDLDNIRPFISTADRPPDNPFARRRTRDLLARWRTTRPSSIAYNRYDREAFLSEEAYLRHLDSRFRGPAWSALLRYKHAIADRFQTGITLENDAGEPYFSRGQTTGFDFLSAHAAWRWPRGVVERVIVGDYRLQFGQGLIIWNGFPSGKSAATLGNEKAAGGATPYTSTNENNFARGAAIALRPFPGGAATLFISSKRVDANLHEEESADPGGAVIDDSGYHRRQSEMARKDALAEFMAGAAMGYNHPLFRAGVTLLHYNYSPRLRVGTREYQRYADDGRHRALAAVAYKGGFSHLYLFGETAISDNGATATVNGARYSGLEAVAFSVIYRRYDKRYISRHAGGFGEYANTSNEEGAYAGIEVTPHRGWRINAYHDRFRYFAPRYRATAPGGGHETLLEVTRRGGGDEWILRVKLETKPEDDGDQTLPRSRQSYRLQYDRGTGGRVSSRTRVEYVRHAKGGRAERGFLLYQECALTFQHPDLKARVRLAYFDVDSYNARVYAHEHDVLYGYALPAYSDRGWRSYINLGWRPSHALTLYFKGGVVYYPDRESIGSSPTRVDGNKLFDLAVQAVVKW
ncbi:MAG: helix-hairpin-helix domain-containing protein [Odoribacteraceae bacterium]|nr:helix-hairpin-helix domain-containing protein [Odoribacteraceae bacterium]